MSQRQCFIGVNKKTLVRKEKEVAEEMDGTHSKSKPSVEDPGRRLSLKAIDDARHLSIASDVTEPDTNAHTVSSPANETGSSSGRPLLLPNSKQASCLDLKSDVFLLKHASSTRQYYPNVFRSFITTGHPSNRFIPKKVNPNLQDDTRVLLRYGNTVKVLSQPFIDASPRLAALFKQKDHVDLSDYSYTRPFMVVRDFVYGKDRILPKGWSVSLLNSVLNLACQWDLPALKHRMLINIGFRLHPNYILAKPSMIGESTYPY